MNSNKILKTINDMRYALPTNPCYMLTCQNAVERAIGWLAYKRFTYVGLFILIEIGLQPKPHFITIPYQKL